MFWALSGARTLAPLVARAAHGWDPDLLTSWATLHHKSVGRAQRLCRATSWTLRRPRLSRVILRLLRNHPHLAGPVVQRVGAPSISTA
jgi:hypothetical protein